MAFSTKCKHLMTLKIKDNKYFFTILSNEKIKITGGFLQMTQKDRIRPDPDPQHCLKGL